MVYEKSALGLNEFITNKRTLGVRERQVLLLVNGVRKLDDLENFFKKDLLSVTIKKLESEGYIHLPNKQQNQQTQHSTPSSDSLSFLGVPNAVEPVCPVKLATVKAILIEAADDYLGIMGRGIKAKIEACINEDSLRQAISSWHMAMRESKLGRESASFLMEQIHQTLQGNVAADNHHRPQY